MTRRRLIAAACAALLATTALAGPSLAAKGTGGKTGGGGGSVTPDPSLICGDTITRSTALTRDYDCSSTDSPGGWTFLVRTPGITIDLGGFSVSGYDGDYVFQIEAPNVTIRNGTIRPMNSEGIDTIALGTVVSKVTFRSDANSYGIWCGVSDVPTSLSVSGSTIVGASTGIGARNCGVTITSTTITEGDQGISLSRDSAAMPLAASLSNVTIYRNRVGLYATGIPMTITNSVVRDNAEYGVEYHGSTRGPVTIQGSTFARNGSSGTKDGLFLEDAYSDGTRSYISNNVFQDNVDDGLVISTPGATDGQFVIKGNTATGNGGWGFAVIYVTVTGTTSANTARYNGKEGFSADGYPAVTFASSSTDRCFGNNGGADQFKDGWSCVTTSR